MLIVVKNRKELDFALLCQRINLENNWNVDYVIKKAGHYDNQKSVLSSQTVQFV